MRICNKIDDDFIVDVVKMCFKEEAVKYFRQTSWRFRQSWRKYFTAKKEELNTSLGSSVISLFTSILLTTELQAETPLYYIRNTQWHD